MTPRGSRLWTLGLVALALLFPAGALLAPWMWPSRSRLPAVSRQLDASILLITAGGLDLDSIGPGTNGASRTRNLDRLAEEGVTILGAYAASNQTMASAAALMTGRCPRDLVRQRGDRLAMDAETLAERFAAAGYVTAAVVANPELLDVGLEQGFGTWDARPGAGAQAVVAAGLACVKDVTDRPWLLWLDFVDFLPYLSQSAEGHGEAPAFHVDDALGRLFDALNADGRMEMATVCVTGLHGQHSRLPDRAGMTHADLTEAVTRVPLLLRLPGRQSRGLVLARLAQGIDIAPTLADWWLREEWSAPTGRSLRPAIVAQRVVNRIAITDGWLADPTGGRAAVAVRCASEGSPLKVLLADDGTSLGAFRLASDPGERQSLSLSAAQLAALRAEWTEALGPQAACLPPAR